MSAAQEKIDWLLAQIADDEIAAMDGTQPFRHIIRHDPQRVMRNSAVYRAIVEEWQDPEDVRVPPEGEDGRDWDEVEAQVASARAIDHVVSLLVLMYEGRPGWQPEWNEG